MARAPIGKHGRDHRPEGHDPSYTGDLHTVGDPGEPVLQNGTPIDGYIAAAFRLIVGPPGTPDFEQPKQTVEVFIALDGVADGDVAWTMPAGTYDFANGLKVALKGHDSTGAYKAWHLDGATGDIVAGI